MSSPRMMHSHYSCFRDFFYDSTIFACVCSIFLLAFSAPAVPGTDLMECCRSRLKRLAAVQSNDCEMLLGIAEVYRVSGWDRSDQTDHYQRVLDAFCEDKSALAVSRFSQVSKYLQKLASAKSDMKFSEMVLKSDAEFPTNSVLHDFATRYTLEERKQVAALWESAANDALDRLIDEGTTVSNLLSEAMQIDPQNALYNYLVAAMMIAKGDLYAAISTIEDGLAKDAVENYASKRIRCRKQVLMEIDCPWPEMGAFLMSELAVVRFVDRSVVRPLLDEARRIRSFDDSEAEHLCALTVAMGKQLLASAFWGGEVLRALDIQHRGLKCKRTSDGSQAVTLEQDIRAVQALLAGPRPDPAGGGTLQEYQSFVNTVVSEGELQALKALRARPRSRDPEQHSPN